MATAEFLDADRMEALEAATIVDGDVVGDNLILTKHDGSTVNAGNVRGLPGVAGVNATAGARWSNSTAYSVGNTVGFAGRVWACIQANTGKPPNFWTAYWQPVNGADVDSWSQFDPYFFGDTLSEWETFWTGGTVSRAYSTVAGEFETGEKSLKVTLAVSSTQRLYEKAYNLVQGGEKVRITVRAKLQAAAAGVTLNAELLQAPSTGSPVPFGSGASSAASDIGAQTLSTTWSTYTFTMTALNNKPQATANIMISTGAGAAAVVLVDSVKVTRGTAVVEAQMNGLQNARLDLLDNLVKGLELNSSTNLNTLTASGTYIQTETTEATLALNYPVASGNGYLEVFGIGSTRVMQRYTLHSTGADAFYMRTYDGTTWGAWKAYVKDNGETVFTITSFNAGWAAYGGSFSAPRLVRKGDMVTLLPCLVKRIVTTSVSFTQNTETTLFPAGAIPSGWRPLLIEQTAGVLAYTNPAYTGGTIAVRANTDGSLGIVPYATGTLTFASTSTWFDLPTLTWVAGQ